LIQRFRGSWDSDPAERTVGNRRPIEPDPDNAGGGKMEEENSPAEKLAIRLPPEWGTEPVPQEKRNLRSFDYFVLWSSLAVGLLVLQAGGLLVPGLSLVEVVPIAVLGSIIGAFMLALAGGLGSKYGIPTMVSLRATLGLKGSYIPAVINAAQLVGWTAFEIFIMANSAFTISGPFIGPYTVYFWIGVFAVFSFLLCIGGPLVVVRQWLEKFAIWITFATAGFLTYTVLTRFPQLFATPGTGSLPMAVALDYVIAMPISWWPLISDYSRFSRDEKGAFVGTFTGYTFANSWFYILGAFLVLAFGVSTSQQIVSSIASITFGGLALALLVVDETDNCFADIYSGAVSIQNVSPKRKQWKLFIGITLIGVFLAALIPQNAAAAYQAFLIFIGAIFVPLLGVLSMDFYIIKKRGYEQQNFYSTENSFKTNSLISWFIGVVIYFILYAYTSLGSSIPSFIASAAILYALEKVT
jgi:NCS1 family nucleobase:cation symporter-1